LRRSNDVREALHAGDAALLYQEQPKQAGLTQRVLDGGVGATGERGDGVDVQGADPVKGDVARRQRGDDRDCGSAVATTWFALATTMRRLICPFS
jgi:hypothetical protein